MRYVVNEFIHIILQWNCIFFIYLFECILQILAAHRCGITRVILPERNLKDLVEVPAAVLANMEVFCFHFHQGFVNYFIVGMFFPVLIPWPVT
jgi:hypothetical protein